MESLEIINWKNTGIFLFILNILQFPFVASKMRELLKRFIKKQKEFKTQK